MSELFSCTTVFINGSAVADRKMKTVQEKANELLKKHEKFKSFDQILLEAIDEALLSLGESVNISIYFHLEDLFKINKRGNTYAG